jgi:gas vesicle protein
MHILSRMIKRTRSGESLEDVLLITDHIKRKSDELDEEAKKRQEELENIRHAADINYQAIDEMFRFMESQRQSIRDTVGNGNDDSR